MPSTNCFVKVSNKAYPPVFDISNGAFTILGQISGSHWATQTSPATQSLFTVKAVSRYVGWAAGSGGTVIRTTNEGANWFARPLPLSDPVYTFSAVDSSTAFAGSYGSWARIWRTTNGGMTWTASDSIPGGFIDGVHMFDAIHGNYLAEQSNSCFVFKRTTDGGITWSSVWSSPGPCTVAGWNNSLAWFDTAHGWFGTNSGHVYWTSDGGTSWSAASHPATNSYSVWFNSPSLGLIGGEYTTNRSTDGGVSWSAASPITGYVVGMAGAIGTEQFWSVAGDANVYYTSNAGTSWTTEPPHGYSGTSTLDHVSFVMAGGSPFGWAVGSTGVILRYEIVYESVKENTSNGVPDRYVLDQNYPNPFNPSTAIHYSLPVGQDGILSNHVSLRVFNLLGQEVATLVNGVEQAGNHEVVWDATGFPSGVYFYRLTAGGFVETKKLVLLR